MDNTTGTGTTGTETTGTGTTGTGVGGEEYSDSVRTTLAAARANQAEGGRGEREALLQALRMRRFFLRHTVQGLDDAQAARRTTVSELCLGGLIKHVAQGERNWMRFVREGTQALAGDTEGGVEQYTQGFRMLPGETLAGLLAEYDEVARTTEELVLGLPDLDVSHPLPPAPWFEPGAHWSARQVLLHLISETAQHCGHADILRESLDGQRTMG